MMLPLIRRLAVAALGIGLVTSLTVPAASATTSGGDRLRLGDVFIVDQVGQALTGGDAITQFFVATSAPCDKGSTHWTLISGPSVPDPELAGLYTRTESGFSLTQPIAPAVSINYANVLPLLGLSEFSPGDYTLELRCVGSLPKDVFGYFTATLTFAPGNVWTLTSPNTTADLAVLGEDLAAALPGAEANGADPVTPTDPEVAAPGGSPAGEPGAVPGASATDGTGEEAAVNATDGSQPWLATGEQPAARDGLATQTIVGGVVAALLVVALVAWLWRRGGRTRVPSHNDPVTTRDSAQVGVNSPARNGQNAAIVGADRSPPDSPPPSDQSEATL